MYQGQSTSDHVHPDDDLPSMSLKQVVLLSIAFLVGFIGLGQFLHWSESHFWQAMGIMISVTLLVMAIIYGLRFVRSRDLCQRCYPSTPTRL